ncbi:ABC transporter ATP-binding protein [Nonomuraea sp. NPDC049695]|uniref:ABC transporter ATP-binding protein n=1 Tax=Nonomuraea sp. NPDC049695 TaxID=3154734 RepID=UPI003442E427
MESAVSVSGLVKKYGDVHAVCGVDLEIRAGEVYAILGPNGAGKSSTVEILEGHRDRDAGEVSVLGVDPRKPTRHWRARMGIVLQSARDLPEITVREAVRHFASFFHRPRNPDETMELVGLTEKADTRIPRLSGGQRRRLDVALAVVGDPELLFLDEPTTGFDPEARQQFWGLIRGLAGTTVVLTTHYLDEAEALADRVAVIAGGRIVAEGDPRTLGGRAIAKATVSWADGEIQTDTPAKEVVELVTRYGGEVPELRVTRPTLEDVYLKLIEENA